MGVILKIAGKCGETWTIREYHYILCDYRVFWWSAVWLVGWLAGVDNEIKRVLKCIPWESTFDESMNSNNRPGFISSSLPNDPLFSDSRYYPEARNCVFTRPIRSSQTSLDGRKLAWIFWKQDQDTSGYFWTEDPANSNCRLMKTQINWLICDRDS